MMNPADHPQITESQRHESPTLWLSLALGSILIHLVLFILASIVSTQTAKVQLDLEPVAVEFVDPTAATARSTAPSRAIAARPSNPSSTQPASKQIQPDITPRSSRLNQPIEPPFVPLPVKRKQLPARPRQPQPSFTRPQPQPQPSQPQPTASSNPLPQQPNPLQPSQPAPSSNPSQGTLPQGGLPDNQSGNGVEQSSDQPPPSESGIKIAQAPEGGSVSVVVSNPRQANFDRQQQPARPIGLEKTVLIRYSAAAAQIPGGIIRMEVPLLIDDKGAFQGIGDGEIKLLFPANVSLDPADLKSIVDQIFTTWRFEPAQNQVGNALKKPQLSNLTIEAQIQFP